jgi:hypothetical protein
MHAILRTSEGGTLNFHAYWAEIMAERLELPSACNRLRFR